MLVRLYSGLQADGCLQCFELFRDVLGKDSQSAEENGVTTEAAEAKKEWRRYTEAQLLAFTRQYHAAAASLADTLENGVFGADKADPQLRQLVIEGIHI